VAERRATGSVRGRCVLQRSAGSLTCCTCGAV
jgi:hypothetical protein